MEPCSLSLRVHAQISIPVEERKKFARFDEEKKKRKMIEKEGLWFLYKKTREECEGEGGRSDGF